MNLGDSFMVLSPMVSLRMEILVSQESNNAIFVASTLPGTWYNVQKTGI